MIGWVAWLSPWLLAACEAERPTDLLQWVGQLQWVADGPTGPVATVAPVGGGAARALWTGPEASFVGPADPRGELALVVTSAELDGGVLQQGLWSVPLAGGPPSRLAGPAGVVREPCWSPDGMWVVYESDAESFRDLYVVGRDGAGARRLTQSAHGAFEPDVSAGGRVAYAASVDGDVELFVSALEGGLPTRWTRRAGEDARPRWSPDGRTLAWVHGEAGAREVWLGAGPGEGRALRASTGKALVHDLWWHPAGDRLALTVQRGGDALAVEIVGVDGALIATLDGPGRDEHPAWSPDGRWIAWSSEREGDAELWVARADGSEARRWSTRAGADWLVRWSK